MRCMLLGSSLEPRPNSCALGTAGSVIGPSVIFNRQMLSLEKPVWREKTRLTSSEVWAVATSKAWRDSGTGSFSSPWQRRSKSGFCLQGGFHQNIKLCASVNDSVFDPLLVKTSLELLRFEFEDQIWHHLYSGLLFYLCIFAKKFGSFLEFFLLSWVCFVFLGKTPYPPRISGASVITNEVASDLIGLIKDLRYDLSMQVMNCLVSYGICDLTCQNR